MSNSDVIDLSQLPAPKVIEELDFETIFQDYLQLFLSLCKDYTGLIESDPAIILLEVMAYREMVVRTRINDAAKSMMLAYASGSDLDNLVADFNIKRLEGESDERLRKRRQLVLESISTAGPKAGYVYHTLSSSVEVKDVSVKSNNPGEVNVSILSTTGDGVASEELIKTVQDYLSDENIRPLTDHVIVQSVSILKYSVKANLIVYAGPSFEVVAKTAKENLDKYIRERHAIGEIVAISGIYDALHVEGVRKVELITPTQDIETGDTEAAFCENIEISTEIFNG